MKLLSILLLISISAKATCPEGQPINSITHQEMLACIKEEVVTVFYSCSGFYGIKAGNVRTFIYYNTNGLVSETTPDVISRVGECNEK